MYLGPLTKIILLSILANNCMANVGTYSVYTPLLTPVPYAVNGPVSALTYDRSVEIYHPRQQLSTYYSAATPFTAPAMPYLSPQPLVNSLPNRNPLVSNVGTTTLTKSVMLTEPVRNVKGSIHTISPPVLAVASASAAVAVPASKQAADHNSSLAIVAPPAPSGTIKVQTSSFNPSTNYDFSYSVHDSISGDIKSQVETRQGGNVRGAYSVLDADGYKRTVAYSADDLNGFNAVVQREPLVVQLTDIANVMDGGRKPTFSIPVQDFRFLSQPSVQQVAFVQQQQNEPLSILSQVPASLVGGEEQQQQEYQSTYPQDQQFPPQHQQPEKDDNQQLEQQQQQQQQESSEEVSSNPASNFDDSDVLEARFAPNIDDQKRNPKIEHLQENSN